MTQIRKGTYYLARVVKKGQFAREPELLVKSILEPNTVRRGKHNWTLISTDMYSLDGINFIYGKLSKYSPDASLMFVEPDIHEEVERPEPNLSIATSPFIYIPSQSGLAFLHEARNIPYWLFAKRFSEIAEDTINNFFGYCEVEPISDLRSFTAKIKMLDSISTIAAKISPPNPLFGPLWKSLRDYLRNRKLENLQIKEEAVPGESIATDLPSLVEEAADVEEGKTEIQERTLTMTDAAILMAADGYGEGTIQGKAGRRTITIKTSDSVRNFTFNRDPDPDELGAAVIELFQRIEKDRNLKH